MASLPNLIKRCDSDAILEARAAAAAYLDAALEAGPSDPRFIAHAFGVAARAYGITQLSRETGIARENLYRSLSGKGNPSLSTLCKVADALGVRLRVKPV